MALPTDPKARKSIPIYSGFVKYFPRAMAAVAQLSQIANEQHNPGEPLHWAKEKSTDEPDALMRHMADMAAGEVYDTDDVLHATKIAWRAMAQLERLLDSGVDCLRSREPQATQEPARPVEGPPATWQAPWRVPKPVPTLPELCRCSVCNPITKEGAKLPNPIRFCPSCGGRGDWPADASCLRPQQHY